MINVGIVGAAGIVSQYFINLINLDTSISDKVNYFLFVRNKKDTIFKIKGENYSTYDIADVEKYNIEILICNTNENTSKSIIESLLNSKIRFIIDASSAYRLSKKSILISPTVNLSSLKNYKGKIISSLNCVVSNLIDILSIINNLFKIKDIYISTYQSISGAGNNLIQRYIDEFNSISHIEGFKDYISKTKYYLKDKGDIYMNNIKPYIGTYNENNQYYSEEEKIISELSLILDIDKSFINVICNRIPTLLGHSSTVFIQSKNSINLNHLLESINSNQNIKPYFKGKELELIDTYGSSRSHIGRLRLINDNKISFVAMSDNLVKGSAYNTILIYKYLINNIIQ